MQKLIIIVLILKLALTYAISQPLPVHIEQEQLYDFIDELALQQLIEINSAVKPYGADVVFAYLKTADTKREKLSARQNAELDRHLAYFSKMDKDSSLSEENGLLKQLFPFFHLSYDPPGFFYKDSFSFLSLKPIWGIDYGFDFNDDEVPTLWHQWGGAAFEARIGNHFSMYANLRDNTESERLSSSSFLVNRIGANYKGKEYSDMRGGLTYSWKWGNLSLIKDHLSWGSGYKGSNIFGKRAPSYSQLKLNLNPVHWFDFNYFHGWLVSNVIDSTRSYITDNGLRRDVMVGKYVAANMFSFKPWKGIHISFGNSVIYSADSPHPAYLTPIFFFKSVDHWLNSTDHVGSYVGQNSQMFMNLSVYRLPLTHVYGSLFVDEFKMSRISDPEEHNFWSYKIGVKHQLKWLKDLNFIIEYTRTSPNTYQHNISTTTFESNDYNLGHYLRDNADELFVKMHYKPYKRLMFALSYSKIRKGIEYGYTDGNVAVTHPFLDPEIWSVQTIRLESRFEIAYQTYLYLYLQRSNKNESDQSLNPGYTAPYFRNIDKTLLGFGFNTGI